MIDRVPPNVEELVSAWRAAGSPAQPAITWPRERWIAALPEHAGVLSSLSHRLDRAAVRNACEAADGDAHSATAAFVAVMAWGFGDVGYGPHRTRRILTQTPAADERLARVVRTLVNVGARAAYCRLASGDDSRLAGLGPSFGTKFLYFCQPRPSRTVALIFDAFVSEWLRRETGLRLDPRTWSVPTHQRYLERMHHWADVLDCAPDDLESSIFRSEASVRGSQWGESAYEARVQ